MALTVNLFIELPFVCNFLPDLKPSFTECLSLVSVKKHFSSLVSLSRIPFPKVRFTFAPRRWKNVRDSGESEILFHLTVQVCEVKCFSSATHPPARALVLNFPSFHWISTKKSFKPNKGSPLHKLPWGAIFKPPCVQLLSNPCVCYTSNVCNASCASPCIV